MPRDTKRRCTPDFVSVQSVEPCAGCAPPVRRSQGVARTEAVRGYLHPLRRGAQRAATLRRRLEAVACLVNGDVWT